MGNVCDISVLIDRKKNELQQTNAIKMNSLSGFLLDLYTQ